MLISQTWPDFSIALPPMSRIIFFILTAITLGQPCNSQSDPIFVPANVGSGFIKYVDLIFIDEVTDGCWTGMSALRASTRLKFEREDVSVLSESPALFSPAVAQVLVAALGYKTGGGTCISYIRFQVGRPETAHWGSVPGAKEYMFSGWQELIQKGILLSSRANNNAQIASFVNEAVDDLLADIISLRRSDLPKEFYKEFPSLLEAPMSMTEFNRRVDSTKR